MATITLLQNPPQALARPGHVLLRSIDWATYASLRDNPANWHVRMTYDQGVLELMSPSRMHEWFAEFVARLAAEWSMELGMTLLSCGSTTLRREDTDKGCEPDKSFYIEHEPLLRSHDDLDLTVHPPPDLVIEVDITAASLPRMPIYRALRVPEVWRHDGERLRFYALDDNGEYAEIAESRQLPLLRPDEVERFLEMRNEAGENETVRSFRKWIRTAVLPKLQQRSQGTTDS